MFPKIKIISNILKIEKKLQINENYILYIQLIKSHLLIPKLRNKIKYKYIFRNIFNI